MDSLSDSVSKIQKSLQSARERLHTLDVTYKRTISTKVAAVGSSLQDSLIQIQHTRSQMNSYLLLLEDIDKPETAVDIAPQFSWVGASLGGIVALLDQAQDSADSALQYAMNCRYDAMDVERDVEAQNDLLDKCKSQAKVVASQAEGSLRVSEILLQQTQAQIRAKEEEIRVKINQQAEKRARKSQLYLEISRTNNQIAETQKQREGKKESAGVGLILTGIGLAAAPWTFGASLGLAAAGAGFAGYKGIRASDLGNEIVALESNVSRLNGEISQDQQAIENLEREQRSLQALVSQHQTEFSTRKSTHQLHQSQLVEANQVEGEIATLKGVTGATISNINEFTSELQRMKECLDKFSSLLQLKSVGISTSASSVNWSPGVLGKRTTSWRMKEFEKQKRVMQTVAQALEKTENDGLLLGSSHTMAFLDIKPWNTTAGAAGKRHKAIPKLSYFRKTSSFYSFVQRLIE
ncbi:hypothetical protein FBEOM_14124 [Fusarium beomiforme]|uniref:Uncharacterized protein n=1 Tax=Fusarium beomiforme TaxID=44412 RepID=A0A9P5A4H3_9HYPO|nr:hypothetical protein FBEOM_14124 [Fusarium beomiforme]